MTLEKSKVTVFGGTGYYGRKVVEHLLKKECEVRVVSRNYQSARQIVGEEAEIIEGDVTENSTIKKSLQGAGSIVICLSAVNKKLFRKMKLIERDAVLAILEEAEAQNISRIVYMSGYDIRMQLLYDLKIPEFGAIKHEIETKLGQSDFNWTILGDAPSMEIFFAFIKNGRMRVPGGGYHAIPSISPEDVGEITAQVALRKDLKGRRLKLTGPEAFSFPEAAERISQVSGKKIIHSEIPLFIINAVSFLLTPFFPFIRFLYKGLVLLNNFPRDLAGEVPKEHQLLRDLFDYEPVSLEMEIKRRMDENTL